MGQMATSHHEAVGLNGDIDIDGGVIQFGIVQMFPEVQRSMFYSVGLPSKGGWGMTELLMSSGFRSFTVRGSGNDGIVRDNQEFGGVMWREEKRVIVNLLQGE